MSEGLKDFVEGCPSNEDMAAFVDARGSDADRKRILSHLGGCNSCYRIFTETVRFQDEQRLSGARRFLKRVARLLGFLIVGELIRPSL